LAPSAGGSYFIRDQYSGINSPTANPISESGWGGNNRWYLPRSGPSYLSVFYFQQTTGNIEWESGGRGRHEMLTVACTATDGYHHPTAGFK
jgi:hypothetical protein